MKCVVEAAKLWTWLTKCQGSCQEQQKSAFSERTEETSATQYFQVQIIIKTQTMLLNQLFSYSGMVTSGNNTTCCR